MKRAAMILLATIAYWVLAIAIIVSLSNLFPPNACRYLFLLGECILEAQLRFGAGLIVGFVLYSLACWTFIRRQKRAGL